MGSLSQNRLSTAVKNGPRVNKLCCMNGGVCVGGADVTVKRPDAALIALIRNKRHCSDLGNRIVYH